jgi:outer membrane protein, heavy metal efflux system
VKIIRIIAVVRFTAVAGVMLLAGTRNLCRAQARLGLQDAVTEALGARASLKADAQNMAVAQGRRQQSSLLPNPTFQFENQNLRPGQTYLRDVDTYAYLTQPLDILGKRKQRMAIADTEVRSSREEYELARRQIAQAVAQTYWTARGAQEKRDILKATADNFQSIVDYHSAQLSVGAISEQDFLRVRLEYERLRIAADLATVEAVRARVRLQKEMGRMEFPELTLSEPLETDHTIPPADSQRVLAQRSEVRVLVADVEKARAHARMEAIAVRPDLSISAGLKRTELADTGSVGTNTVLAGAQITVPIFDRNQGNRAAADAEVIRQQQLLAAAQSEVLADYYQAMQEYQLRRGQVTETLQPLRQHADEIAEIAQAVYTQGGGDLLRLLDAQRARLDAQLAWVQGMVEYQQSIANLEAAEGVAP